MKDFFEMLAPPARTEILGAARAVMDGEGLQEAAQKMSEASLSRIAAGMLGAALKLFSGYLSEHHGSTDKLALIRARVHGGEVLSVSDQAYLVWWTEIASAVAMERLFQFRDAREELGAVREALDKAGVPRTRAESDNEVNLGLAERVHDLHVAMLNHKSASTFNLETVQEQRSHISHLQGALAENVVAAGISTLEKLEVAEDRLLLDAGWRPAENPAEAQAGRWTPPEDRENFWDRDLALDKVRKAAAASRTSLRTLSVPINPRIRVSNPRIAELAMGVPPVLTEPQRLAVEVLDLRGKLRAIEDRAGDSDKALSAMEAAFVAMRDPNAHVPGTRWLFTFFASYLLEMPALLALAGKPAERHAQCMDTPCQGGVYCETESIAEVAVRQTREILEKAIGTKPAGAAPVDIVALANEAAERLRIAEQSDTISMLLAIRARGADPTAGADECGTSNTTFEVVRDFLLAPLKEVPLPPDRLQGGTEFAYLEQTLANAGRMGGLAELALKDLRRRWARMVPVEHAVAIITGLAEDIIYSRAPLGGSVGAGPAVAWLSRQALERLHWARKTPQRQVPVRAMQKLLDAPLEVYEAVMQRWPGGMLAGEAAVRETLNEVRLRLDNYTLTSSLAEQA